jgi:Type I phosphodiesterase / nucleotide pyrophosphatase
MGYAKHIGRVGALAVTLGVGVAMATTPGIAYADSSGSSSQSVDSPSTSSSSTSSSTTAGSSTTTSTGASGVNGADGDDADMSAADLNEPSSSAGDDTGDPGEDAEEDGDAEEQTSEEDTDTPPRDEDTPPRDEDAPPSDDTPPTDESLAQDDNPAQGLESGEPADQQESNRSASAIGSTLPDASGDVESFVAAGGQSTGSDDEQSQNFTSARLAEASAESVAAPSPEASTTTVTTFAAVSAPAELAEQPPTLVSVVTEVVTNLVAAVLQPMLSWATTSPIQIPILSAMLAAVRNEMERNLFGRTAPVTAQHTISQLVDPADQHVLVIGIDGTNLSRVLADDTNENFFELVNTSTNSAPSIVGHTTVSNPSWTAILTGAWDNKTGVINNVFTPWTYDKWPTVFNQLESFDSDIETKAIADWDVIAAIAAAGSVGADEVVPISQIPGDTNWSATDAAVTAETVKTIEGTEEGYDDVPNFLFTYLVQVDENGHMFGGASEEYKQTIQRTDDNLGAILDAVAAREAATCAANACEDWTVIVVTDHGHQPQIGFGHGFQSPDETETFVIVDGPAFGDGFINTEYEIVDVTPTVLSLFGAPQGSNFDGVPLTSLSGSDVGPLDQDALHDALRAQLAMNTYPDPITNLALSLRTIFAFIPFYVYDAGLPSPIGDILYVATNIPAQIVAFLTGVQGASIFPVLPPPPPSTFIHDQETTSALLINQDCGDGRLAAAGCIAS